MPEPVFRCPRCASDRVATIVYGSPPLTRQLERDVAAGRVVLAGCLVTDGAPARQCTGCGHGFGMVPSAGSRPARR